MKEVILSADGDSMVYLVPEVVANDLGNYCTYFCDKWMKTSPHAKKYKIKNVYLNEYVFPEKKSVFVKNLGWTDFGRNLPVEYKDHPYFNF